MKLAPILTVLLGKPLPILVFWRFRASAVGGRLVILEPCAPAVPLPPFLIVHRVNEKQVVCPKFGKDFPKFDGSWGGFTEGTKFVSDGLVIEFDPRVAVRHQEQVRPTPACSRGALAEALSLEESVSVNDRHQRSPFGSPVSPGSAM